VLLALFLGTFSLTPCHAADPQQLQQALMKAQGLLRQIAQQKAAAEAELAKLRVELAGKEKALRRTESEIETQKTELAQTAASLSAASGRASALDGSLTRTKGRLAKTEDKLREVAGMYKDTRAKLQQTEAEREALELQLADTRKELADAEKKNLALYETNTELLAQYRGKSAWDAIRQREPFTGIRDVSVENQVQGYEDRMYEQLREVNMGAAER
jgi:chromosome segregation ATPase